jgi:hypothetical protein
MIEAHEVSLEDMTQPIRLSKESIGLLWPKLYNDVHIWVCKCDIR